MPQIVYLVSVCRHILCIYRFRQEDSVCQHGSLPHGIEKVKGLLIRETDDWA